MIVMCLPGRLSGPVFCAQVDPLPSLFRWIAASQLCANDILYNSPMIWGIPCEIFMLAGPGPGSGGIRVCIQVPLKGYKGLHFLRSGLQHPLYRVLKVSGEPMQHPGWFLPNLQEINARSGHPPGASNPPFTTRFVTTAPGDTILTSARNDIRTIPLIIPFSCKTRAISLKGIVFYYAVLGRETDGCS